MEKVAPSLRDKLLVRLLFRLGCRISELLVIKVADIDFERATITILHLKTRIRLSCPKCKAALAKRHQFCPSCGIQVDEVVKRRHEHRRIRILPIDRQTLEMLGNYITTNLAAGGNSPRFLFNLNRHQAWQIVRNCAKQARIPSLVNPETGRIRGVSPHRLRDAFSVHAIKRDDSGDGLRMLQEHRDWYERLWRE